jgi:hypothetical protein
MRSPCCLCVSWNLEQRRKKRRPWNTIYTYVYVICYWKPESRSSVVIEARRRQPSLGNGSVFRSFNSWVSVRYNSPLTRELSLSGKFLIILVSTGIFVAESRGTHGHILLSHDSGRLDSTLCDWQVAKLLLALASTVILGSESHETHDHVLLSHDSGNHVTLPSPNLCPVQ